VRDKAPAAECESLPLALAGCIDRACDRYETEWKAGERPRIEAYLAEARENERPALLRELLLLEIEFRRAGGERPTREEYVARFQGHDSVIGSVFEETFRAHAQLGSPVDGPVEADGDALSNVAALGPEGDLGPRTALPDFQVNPMHAEAVGTVTSAGTRFHILRLHDRGGLGNVYVARDL
jgi:hypothetical protein